MNQLATNPPPVTLVPRADLRRAEAIVHRLPAILEQRGLSPAFQSWLITSYAGMSLLFAVLDVDRIKRLEDYTTANLLHHLSTALGGLPVYKSNSSGLRYVVLLGQRPRLPRRVALPELSPGRALLGLRYTGTPVAIPWGKLGHLLVAGKTGSGKSGFLRLLAYQAIANGAQLLAADLDGTTFPMLAGHPSLLAPVAASAEAAPAIIARALGECDHRTALFSQVGGYPDSLDEYNNLAVEHGHAPLPRLLVILDEFNATVSALGGVRGGFADDVARLGWRGRKFGIDLVFAAQDFAKDIVGKVRDQIGAAICFRVRGLETARNVGCPDAVRIPEGRSGLAVADRWGPMQAYFLDKSLLIQVAPGSAIPDDQRALALRALEEQGGRMTLAWLQSQGLTERQARDLAEDWERRGWLQSDRKQGNARSITAKMREILSNRQTGQTGSNPSKPPVKPASETDQSPAGLTTHLPNPVKADIPVLTVAEAAM